MQSSSPEDRYLADLRLTDPYDDIKRIQALKGGPLQGSCQWILEHPDFLQWRDDEKCQLLWIQGNPGTGKTMLLIGIINELERQTTDFGLLSFFFCQAADSRLNTATGVLRGLIYLLVIQQPSLMSHIQRHYDQEGRELLADGTVAFYALSRMFQNMLKNLKSAGAYLVIDALDECTTDLHNILDLISSTLSAPSRGVKWIVSSRPSNYIESRLMLNSTTIKLSLELNMEAMSNDIDAYIDHKLSGLHSVMRDDALRRRVRDTLRRKANGLFIWVGLVMEQLETTLSEDDVRAVLEEVPSDLVLLYDQMLHRITQRELCRLVLSIVVITRRPLHLLELPILAGHQNLQNMAHVTKIVNQCGSFLTVRGDLVYIVHQSARDFLITNAEIFPEGQAGVHYDIFSRSLSALSQILRKNVYNLSYPGLFVDQVKPPEVDPLAPVSYCCVFWADHLYTSADGSLRCKRETPEEEEAVFTFLQTHFLHWLESLSLLRKISDGILAIRKILKLFQASDSTDLRLFRLLIDAERFASRNGSIIIRAPLQIYGSALVFSPIKSEVKIQFWTEKLQQIESIKGVNRYWGVCQQVLEGHEGSVWAVTFSPDGQQLASASNDKIIRLWDATTGTQTQALEGHSGTVKAVAFSPNGRELASGSYDRTVRLWDTTTGECQVKLTDHSDWVRSIAFSNDGEWLVSGSNDKTIRIWNNLQGRYNWVGEGHNNWVNSVTFSPDDSLIASGSYDKTVKLWDTTTRAHRITLGPFKTTVNSVTFSPNGRWLAIALDDKTVRLWNTETEAYGKILEGHTHWVTFTAFSPDGKFLASSSNDKSIRIWDLETGDCQQILHGHRGSITSISFLIDGKQLASASSDKTVRLWDTNVAVEEHIPESHNSPITAVALTQNGELIASASKDKTIRLWHTNSATCQRTLEGHNGVVTAVAFSTDGIWLASASEDKTVRLWDTSTKMCEKILKGHNGTIRAIAFSLDGRRLASASQDGKVLLWDVKEGTCQDTLEGLPNIKKLSFTKDGHLLSDRGLLSLGFGSNTLLRRQAQLPCTVTLTKDWVRYNGQDLLWLPQDYRATCCIFQNNLLILGHESGRLTILKFSSS